MDNREPMDKDKVYSGVMSIVCTIIFLIVVLVDWCPS